MGTVIVCYKWVLDEADLRIREDRSVDLSRAKYKISDYDRNSIEAACRLAREIGAETLGISCGGDETKKSFADALARGPDKGVWIHTGGEHLDSAEVSALLAAAVQKCEDASVVFCSDGSSDEYARQTAPRIAAKLDWPVVTSVVAVEADGDSLLVRRKLDKSIQTLRVQTPCVIAVLPEIGPAPVPGLRQVMAARKKPLSEYSAADLCSPTGTSTRAGLVGYLSSRKGVLITGDSDAEKVKRLAADMRREGVL